MKVLWRRAPVMTMRWTNCGSTNGKPPFHLSTGATFLWNVLTIGRRPGLSVVAPVLLSGMGVDQHQAVHQRPHHGPCEYWGWPVLFTSLFHTVLQGVMAEEAEGAAAREQHHRVPHRQCPIESNTAHKYDVCTLQMQRLLYVR